MFVLDSCYVHVHYTAARCRRKQSATALYSTTLTWQTGFAVIASHAICACVRVLDRHNVLTIATFCLRSCCHCIGVYDALRCCTQSSFLCSSPLPSPPSSHSHPFPTSLSFIFPPSFSVPTRLSTARSTNCRCRG